MITFGLKKYFWLLLNFLFTLLAMFLSLPEKRWVCNFWKEKFQKKWWNTFFMISCEVWWPQSLISRTYCYYTYLGIYIFGRDNWNRVKPHNSRLLCQQEFFHYFEGSFSINAHFGHLGFSTIEGFSTILTAAIAKLYCTWFSKFFLFLSFYLKKLIRLALTYRSWRK